LRVNWTVRRPRELFYKALYPWFNDYLPSVTSKFWRNEETAEVFDPLQFPV
jgi:hypothetical protein